ncbi:uroporphyrinogen-III C-methyltransferase [Halomonas piscis]|uniref:Uroporphyrinogen-III C-methyltransferase n=1 Tax=Halomonas piscis TaxID=3031727 RepID=A0ABY9YZU3_9GAMM|nr:uroporphyrinogen-III C-methyltransferase [Halomonas piscis]WNK20400.1 uroporphyrinogen-III C-methyltransferase [Halomonas piscis]
MNQHDNESSDAPKAATDARRDDTATQKAASANQASSDAAKSAGKGKNKGGSKPSPGSSKTTGSKNPSSPSGGKPPEGGGKAAPQSKTPTGGGGGGKATLAIALAVIVALALVLLAWQGWQRLEQQQQRLETLASQAGDSASQQRVDKLESRLERGEEDRDQALDDTLDSLRSEFSDYRQSVDETLDKVLTQLSQEQDTDERDWLHAEAAYLLRLANQRLQLEGDVQGAAALLRSADQRLKEADNPALTSVRREIASDLAALDAVPEVDLTGLYLALDAQQERIKSLHLNQDVEAQKVESGMEEAPTGTFQRQLARFGEELKDLVVIRNHDEALETLITPQQESYLRQSLQMILEQAQLAQLKQDKTLYETSIDDALELLNAYFDTDRADTQSVISRLEELKQAQIKPDLPDISGSQQALAEFIDKRFETRRSSGGGE